MFVLKKCGKYGILNIVYIFGGVLMKRIVSFGLVLSFLFILLSPMSFAKAADTQKIGVIVEYDQTGARDMFKLLNEYRASHGTPEDDNQFPYSYDYDLEKAAMQRAVEIAFRFADIRPDGEEYRKTISEYGFDISPRGVLYGENILFGTKNSMELEDAFNTFCQEEKNIVNIMGYYDAVGMAHIKLGKDKDIDFWVQVFATRGNNFDYTAPVDGERTVEVNLPVDYAASIDINYESGDHTVAVGSTVNVPKYTGKISFTPADVEEELTLKLAPLKFESSDSFVKASDGKMTGLSVGTGKISVQLLGNAYSYNVNVTSGSGNSSNPEVITPTPVATPTPEVTQAPDKDNTDQTQKLKKGDKFSSDGLKYTVTGSKTVTVTGATDKKALNVTIPATVKYSGVTYKVTKIGANAFKGMTKLTAVTIGKNVKTIGKKAFYGCKALSDVTISGTSVKSIGTNAFNKLASKTVISVPKAKNSAYSKLLKKSKIGKKTTVETK